MASKLHAGLQLGDYVIGQPMWPLRIADAYRANGPTGAATVYVVNANIAQHPQVREAIIAGTRVAAALEPHKHLVRTLAAGLTGDILWIATEDVDGSLVRDMLVKKRQAGAAGFGARGTANLMTGVCAVLADVHHGALSSESVVVSKSGRVRIADLALGPGTAAAIAAKLIPQPSCLAPEVSTGAPPDGPGDVYAIGALLYEALVGKPLERGGPRPSEVVPDANLQIDEVVARACHRDPAKRFGRPDVVEAVVVEALDKGGALFTRAVPLLEKAPTLEDQAPSLATEPSQPHLPAASGNLVVDRALAAALADTTEKWLVSKGRLDYGPFSLQQVVDQIEKGEIGAGSMILDKDSGERCDVAEHPLLGPVVDSSRARLDDQRRARAEVVQQKREKKRGALLYALIGLGVVAVGLAVYFIIQGASSDDTKRDVKTVKSDDVQTGSLKVTVSLPKTPPATKHKPGGGGSKRPRGGGGDYTKNASDDLSLDLSDDSDETETLSMDKVGAVYSSHGQQLGGCLMSSGAGQANIAISIDGPSGRVNVVKVNGQAAGALWGCINRVMRSLQFPPIHGRRTRAEFDIGLGR
jgi:serine/threonine protein kinase